MSESVCVLQHRTDPRRQRKAEPGLLVCYGCLGHIEHALRDLPTMWAELVDRHLGSPAGGAPITGTPERSVPYRDPIGDERELIQRQLSSWSARVAQDRDVRPPRSSAPADTAPFLLTHLSWALTQPFTERFGTDMLDRNNRSFSLLYPSGRRKFRIGPCTEWYDVTEATWIGQEGHPKAHCQGSLHAIIRDTDQLLPSELQCSSCGFEVPASGWVTYGRKLATAV